MDNKELHDGISNFRDVVQDAINSGNYQKLNQHVQESMNDSVEEIKKGMQNEVNQWKDIFHASPNGQPYNYKYNHTYQKNTYQQQKPVQPVKPVHGTVVNNSKWNEARRRERQLQIIRDRMYARQPKGNVMGTVMGVIGYTFSGFLLMAAATIALLMIVWPAKIFGASALICAVLGTGFLGLGVAGSKIRGKVKRFREYVKIIGDRAYCNIEELANKTGKTPKMVIKDIRKMIEDKMFLQGHMDQKETCLIVTNEMYNQYLLTEKQAKERAMIEAQKKDQRNKLPEECQAILEEGNWYINYIRQCNDDLPGEEISEKLDRLEKIITRIFQEVEKNNALAADLRKFMNYYLPTTKKLLDAYREMDKETITGDAIETTKTEIEKTIDTINQAFENLLNSFFKDKELDIASDISVLHTMLAQEGLTGNDFDEMRKQKKGE